jgi:hypothetical protein
MQFWQFFLTDGARNPSIGANVLGHIGRGAARGERAALHGGKHGGGSVGASCSAREQTWAVVHVCFVFALA